MNWDWIGFVFLGLQLWYPFKRLDFYPVLSTSPTEMTRLRLNITIEYPLISVLIKTLERNNTLPGTLCNLKSKIFSSTIKCKSIPGTVVHDLGGIDNEVKLSKSKSMKLKMHKIEVFVFDENHQFFSSVFVWFFKHHKAPSQKH